MWFCKDDTGAEREQSCLTVWQSSTPGCCTNGISAVAKLSLSCLVLTDDLWPATPSVLQLELAGGLRHCFGMVTALEATCFLELM